MKRKVLTNLPPEESQFIPWETKRPEELFTYGLSEQGTIIMTKTNPDMSMKTMTPHLVTKFPKVNLTEQSDWDGVFGRFNKDSHTIDLIADYEGAPSEAAAFKEWHNARDDQLLDFVHEHQLALLNMHGRSREDIAKFQNRTFKSRTAKNGRQYEDAMTCKAPMHLKTEPKTLNNIPVRGPDGVGMSDVPVGKSDVVRVLYREDTPYIMSKPQPSFGVSKILVAVQRLGALHELYEDTAVCDTTFPAFKYDMPADKPVTVGHCVRCRSDVEMVDPVLLTNKKNVPLIQSRCTKTIDKGPRQGQVCGSKMNRFIKKTQVDQFKGKTSEE